MLKERLNLLGKIGCAICLLGSTSIVIHSPKEEEVSSMADLATKMKDAGIFYSMLQSGMYLPPLREKINFCDFYLHEPMENSIVKKNSLMKNSLYNNEIKHNTSIVHIEC